MVTLFFPRINTVISNNIITINITKLTESSDISNNNKICSDKVK